MTDFQYETARNRLIPLAEQKANREHGDTPKLGTRDKWVKAWNRCYLGEMDRLAKEVELI